MSTASNEYMRAYYAANIERLREQRRRSRRKCRANQAAYDVQYVAEHREADLEKSRRYKALNKDKVSCRNKLANAIRRGRIIRPLLCSKCEEAGKIVAHHHDYRKPFDVEWLCTKCHGVVHRIA